VAAKKEIKWISPKRAATILGKTVEWLMRARKKGSGPPYYNSGGRIQYDEDEVIAFRDSWRRE